MTYKVFFPKLEDLLSIGRKLLGENLPIRDISLLESAVARPRTTVFGEDAYPTLWDKAAALLHSIVLSHPLVDGNKRLGWLATTTFLGVNGYPADNISPDDAVDLVERIAIEHLEVETIAQELRALAIGLPSAL